MRIWRLYMFGREVIRTERQEDPDKTMAQAIHELIEEEDATYIDDTDLRIAGDDEHVIFTGEAEISEDGNLL